MGAISAARVAEVAEHDAEPSSGRRRAGSAMVLRQVAMLQLLPIHPRRIGTRTICERLTAMGFCTTVRTIQRDLLALQTFFPIEYDGKSRPYSWRWARDADAHPLPVAIESAPVRIVALVTAGIARQLGDAGSSLHHDGRLRVTLSVSGGPSLRRWVLGFGDGMEVLEPTSLRDELREVARVVAGRYDHHSA